jgi:predicted MFS family arabinose efflux permease
MDWTDIAGWAGAFVVVAGIASIGWAIMDALLPQKHPDRRE